MLGTITKMKNKHKILKYFNEQKYGVKDVENVYELYGKYYDLELSELLLEREEFVYETYKHRKEPFRAFFKREYPNLKLKSPGLGLCGRHHLIIPFDAAICDRGFSIQNLIITKDRTLIKTAYLRDGMIVCIEGPKWANGTAVKDLMLRALERFSKCANYE